MEERDFANCITALDEVLQAEGLLAGRYVAIQSIVADELKAVNTDRKNNRKTAEGILEAAGNAIDAVKVANALLPTMPKGADAGERKRAQRRRDWLKARLTAVYPQFDFITDGNKLMAQWCGTASMRQAREWRVILDKVVEYGLGLDATVEDIAAVIAATERQAGTGVAVHDDVPADILAAIAARITGMTERMGQEQAS